MNNELKVDFCNKVIDFVTKNKETYIDSVIAVSEEYGFGPELGAKLLSKPIIEKIRMEGEDINLLPKMSQLPF